MRLLAAAVTALLLSTGAGPSPTSVTLCDLIREPERYNGAHVIVRATWKHWFEISQLYCLDCNDKGRVWLEFSDDLARASRRALKSGPNEGVVNLTVDGVFRSGGGFGHLAGYQYKFTAAKVSNVALVVKGLAGPDVTEKAEKQWACGGTTPK